MASNSPCAACKFLRRKCIQDCPFAPYFPPDQPQKFTNVHRVFGASNVAKILQELNAAHREDAVTSLAFEAETRLRDPVYGCVGVISTLTTKLRHVQSELFNAKQELCNYIGTSGMVPLMQQQPHPHQFLQQQHPTHQNLSPSFFPFGIDNNPPMALGLAAPGAASSQNQLIIREHQQVQQRRDLIESQNLAAAVAREQELMRSYEQQQQQQQLQEQQQEFLRYNNIVGYDPGSGVHFNNATSACLVNPAVPVVQFDNNQFQLQHHQQQLLQQQQQQQQQAEERHFLLHHQQQHQQQQPLLLLQQAKQQQRDGSEEGTSVIGPPA